MSRKILTEQYYNLTTNGWEEFVYSFKVGDIFKVKISFMDSEATYMVIDRKLSLYDENYDHDWETPVPIYTLHNLETNEEYIGVLPFKDAFYELLA